MAESAEILPETIFIFNFNKTSTEMSFECKQQEDVCVLWIHKRVKGRKKQQKAMFCVFSSAKNNNYGNASTNHIE